MNNEYLEKRMNKIDEEVEREQKFDPISFLELMKKEFGDTSWLVEGLIPLEGTTVVSGSPASFKTWFVLDMALRVAGGNIVFDRFATTQAGVLIIDEESGEKLLQQRLKKLSQNLDLPIYFLSLCGFRLRKDIIEQIIEISKEKQINLIVFDSLIRIHGADENDATKMAGVFKHLKELNKNGITVVFTHHNRKQGFFKADASQAMRGSSDILASVDCHLAIEKKNKDEFITVRQTKNRLERELAPFKLGIINENNNFAFEYFGELDEVQTKKDDCREMIKDILEQQDKPMYKKELFDGLREAGIEIGYSTFKNASREMIEKGELFEKKGEKNKTYCSLMPFNEEVGQNSLSL